MNRILDLRFVIGVFFTTVGLLLFGYSFVDHAAEGAGVNFWSGVAFTIFGGVMIVLSFVKDANDELVEEEV